MEENEVKSELMAKPFWSRKMTDVLKAVAIVLMFIHHFFSIKNYLPETVSYSWASDFEKYFTAPTKICVGIFAFITGYMYYFSRKKAFEDSCKSSGKFLIRYWVVAVPLIILAILSGVYSFSLSHVILELFGMEENVMLFDWYVYFYIFIMFFLPAVIRLTRDKVWLILLLTFLVFNFMCGPLYSLISDDLYFLQTVFSRCWTTVFTAISGYVVAKTGIFPKLKKITDKIPSFLRYLILLLLLGASFMTAYFFYIGFFTFFEIGKLKFGLAFNSNAVAVPFFVFCLVELLSFVEKTKAIRIFEILGKYSVYMWFWHCMFFGALGEYTKRLLYAPKNPILVLLWGIAICLSFSVLSSLIVDGLILRKKPSTEKQDK